MWVFLGLYIAMTVVVPVINGARVDRAFVEHSAIVLIMSAFAAGACALIKHLRRH